MKVYTVYLNGDQGWTGDTTDGFYTEIINTNDYETFINELPSKEEFDNELKELVIGESFKIVVGIDELEFKCEEISEEEFNSLGEFTGW